MKYLQSIQRMAAKIPVSLVLATLGLGSAGAIFLFVLLVDNPDSQTPVLIAALFGFIGLAVIALVIVLIRTSGRWGFIWVALGAYVLLEMLATIYIISTPIFFIQSFIVVLAAGWTLWLFIGRRIINFEELVDDKSQEKILRVFESDEFLTALRETLPSGEKDAELGLDFIPFILHRANERQVSHNKTSSRYLKLLFGTAILFSLIIVSLGYVVLVTDSVGLAGQLREISSLQRSINESIIRASPDLDNNIAFQACCEQAIQEIASSDIDIVRDLSANLVSEPTVKKARELFFTLSSIDTQVMELEERERIERARDLLSEFEVEYGRIPEEIGISISKLDAVVERTQELLDVPEAQTAETLKRIAIGVVVASFFLAVLKYIANLYASERNLGVRAAFDELEARRFYVCLRCAQNDPDILKDVLRTFLKRDEIPHVVAEHSTSEQKLNDLTSQIQKLAKLFEGARK